MPIQFIDNNNSIDKKTRTLIRSHVAKGKNLGRTLHRPSRHPRKRQVGTSAIPSPEPPSHKRPEAHKSQDLELSLSIQRKFQDDISTCLPFDVSRACRRLFYQFVTFINVAPYPLELRKTIININGPRMFLRYAFVDEAFFHCLVATSVAAPVYLPATRQETVEAFHHLSRSLRLVNQRLGAAGDAALSDSTLAVVIAMTQHERLVGNHRSALVHFDGLQRIIALRGGISALVSECPGVAQKALRADFDFALQLGSPTRFSADCVPGQATLDRLREKCSESRACSLATPAFVVCADVGLRRVFEDVSALAWLVNNRAVHGVRVDDYDFHNALLCVGYRLLAVRAFNAPVDSDGKLEVLLHLGLAALMSMFFLTLGVKPLEVLLLKHYIVSATLDQRCEDMEGQELLLWVLFTGKASVFRDAEEDTWLVPQISQIASQLGLATWEQVSRTLQKLPWVGIFSNDAARTLWDRTESFSRPI